LQKTAPNQNQLMKYKKIFFLVFTLLIFANSFSQKKKTSDKDKKGAEKTEVVNTKKVTDKTETISDKKSTLTEKSALLKSTQANKKSAENIKILSATDKKLPITSKITLPTDTISQTVATPSQATLDSLANANRKFKAYKKNVHVSYYHDKFNGKRTSSGIKFDNQKYTAAHRKFSFGTKVRITNPANGKSVVVEVQDRGPFTRGREIDITKRAFMEIVDNKNTGGLTVNIEVEDK